MKLEIGNFHVKDIQFGPVTSFKDGILTVNREEAMAALNPDGKLKHVQLHIARPGEQVRILPVKEIVEPRARPDGRAAFPGNTGPTVLCGEGVVHALKDMAVIAVGKYGGWMEGVLDMSGPGAEVTPFSQLVNLCFTAENTDPAEDPGSQHMNLNYRRGALLLAEYLAQATIGQTPQDWERFELTEVEDKTLPRVALVVQISAFYEKNDGFCDELYGVDTRLMMPTLLHPNELLDGALTFGSLISAGKHTYTYGYQNFPILKRLYEEHGKTLRFVGVIAGDDPSSNLKIDRSAVRTTAMAKLLGCDGAIYYETGDGACDVSFFKTLACLEDHGIATVGVTNETPGHDGTTQVKVVLNHQAKSMVVTGNSENILELPRMETVIGDLESLTRDSYPGCWADDPLYGPSVRPDGTLLVDQRAISGSSGSTGWSYKTNKSF